MVEYSNPAYNPAAAAAVTRPRTPPTSSPSTPSSPSSSSGGASGGGSSSNTTTVGTISPYTGHLIVEEVNLDTNTVTTLGGRPATSTSNQPTTYRTVDTSNLQSIDPSKTTLSTYQSSSSPMSSGSYYSPSSTSSSTNYSPASFASNQFANVGSKQVNAEVAPYVNTSTINVTPTAAYVQQQMKDKGLTGSKVVKSQEPQQLTEAQLNFQKTFESGAPGLLNAGKQFVIGTGEFFGNAITGVGVGTIGYTNLAIGEVKSNYQSNKLYQSGDYSLAPKFTGGVISENKPGKVISSINYFTPEKATTVNEAILMDPRFQTTATLASLYVGGKYLPYVGKVASKVMEGMAVVQTVKTISDPSQENLRALGPFLLAPAVMKLPGYAKRSVIDTSVKTLAQDVKVKPSTRLVETSSTERSIDIGTALKGQDQPSGFKITRVEDIGKVSQPVKQELSYFELNPQQQFQSREFGKKFYKETESTPTTKTEVIITKEKIPYFEMTPAQQFQSRELGKEFFKEVITETKVPIESSKAGEIKITGPSGVLTETSKTFKEVKVKGYTKSVTPKAPTSTVFQIPIPEINLGAAKYRTGFPLVEVINTGRGKYIRGVNPFTNKPTEFGVSITPKGYKFGPVEQKGIELSKTAIQTTPVEKAGERSFLQQYKNLRPEEVEAQLLRDKAAFQALGSKGQDVETFTLGIEGLKNPQASSKIIGETVNVNKGYVYGSAILSKSTDLPISVNLAKAGELPGYKAPTTGTPTGLLPEPFTVKPGDLDLMFKTKTTEQIGKILEKTTTKLQKAGEEVYFEPKENTIYFKSGEKFIEAKSGIDQAKLNLGDYAAEGFSGFVIDAQVTTKLGGVRSSTVSSQFVARTAAASLISPGGKGTAEFKSFEQGGILGKSKPSNMRGSKDVAQYFIEGYGNAQLKMESLNPLTRAKGMALKKTIDQIYSKYTPEQQMDIYSKMVSKRGNEFTIALEGPVETPSASKTFADYVSAGKEAKIASVYSPSFSSATNYQPTAFLLATSPSPTTKSESPSLFSSSPSSSPYSSPSAFSLSTSPSPSPTSPSPFSPSPGSPSPPSPSPPSPSPGSPSPSPPSPSPGSPSPIVPSPTPPISPPPSIILAFLKKELKKKKKGFAVEVRRKGKFKAENKVFESTGEAMAYGQSKLREGAAATFKVIESAFEPTSKFSGRLDLSGLYTKQEKGQTLYIQKQKERLSSIGEKKEITYKGIAASKSKSMFSKGSYKPKTRLY
jgi:hypothetical protein